MSIHIPSTGLGPPLPAGITRGVGTNPELIRRSATPGPERAAQIVKANEAVRLSNARAAEVPDGIDPALWTVLTSEERTFFAQTGAMGPLTYGPGVSRGSLPSMRLGGRIDVKV